MPDNLKHLNISRRRFLRNTGWLATGVTVLAACSPMKSLLPVLPSTGAPEPDDGLLWLQVTDQGRIRFFCPRIEMGQGSVTGLTQVVAEELNVSPSDIDCVTPDTSQVPPFRMTVGSEGISDLFDPVSVGAARLREKLRGLAASQTGVAVADIGDHEAGFSLPDGRTLSYAEIISPEPVVVTEDDPVARQKDLPRYALSRKSDSRAIGHGTPDNNLLGTVTGAPLYSRDVILPDMLYGKVVKPSAFEGKIIKTDIAAARASQDVVDVVVHRENGFIGVVASTFHALQKAVEKIVVDYELPYGQHQKEIESKLDVMQARKRHELEHELVSVGNLKTGHAASEHHVSALYRTSMAAHAAMEPRAAVADVRPDGVDIHCGSQDPYFVRGLVAKAIRRDADEVIVHSHRLGGGFGGRVRCQAAEEAAVLSAAVGKPVKVQWSREEEFQNNYYQPAFSHYIEAGVTKAGKIGYWDHDFVSSPIITGAVPKELSWITDSIVADEGTARGGTPPWQTAHRRVRYADIRTFVPVGAWRGLGSAPNMFAIESLMDELALGAKIDPLQFRLDNLPEDDIRLRAVLNRIAAMVDLKTSLPSDTGRGLACGTYKGETAVAIVAEVRVDRKSRHVQVRKIWCAQDCGRVINPQLVENQIMGNIIWGCSMALKERLTVADGAMEQTNFDSYDLLRHDEAPDIETSLVQSDDATPTGVGEAALGPVAPAITNAIAAASGVRIRDLPVSLTDLFSTDRA